MTKYYFSDSKFKKKTRKQDATSITSNYYAALARSMVLALAIGARTKANVLDYFDVTLCDLIGDIEEEIGRLAYIPVLCSIDMLLATEKGHAITPTTVSSL